MAQQRISSLMGRGDDGGDARAFLGVFGKHPGWNDHIDDIGLRTDRLVQIKRILYVEGIGGNIDAGSWDSLPEAGRLPDFDHTFLWRMGGEVALGRFWSSSDGKGRKRYPMVVAAQVRGWPVSWQLKYVLPVLQRLEEEFKAATTSDRVIALAQNATKELEDLTAGDPAPSTRFEGTATATLADDPAMGPERRGTYRLLYQMERDLSAYLRGGGKDSSRSRTVDLSPRHLRVPRCVNDEAASMLLWWRFLGEHLGESTPIVLVSPSGAGWIDLLVGEPGVSQFICVRANEQTVPLTTEIPYTFDAAFTARADERIAGATAPATADQSGKKPPPVTPANVSKAIEKIAGVGGLEPRQIMMIAAACVLGLGVVIGLIVLFSGGMRTVNPETPGGDGGTTPGRTTGGSTPSQGTPASGSGGTPQAAATNPNFTQVDRDNFKEWCNNVDWALELRQRLTGRDLTPLQSDQHLSETLLPLLETLRNPVFEIDPRTAAPGGPRSLANLAEAPPAAAQTDAGIEKARAALRVIRGIRGSLASTAWPARASLEQFAAIARQVGWTGLGEALAGASAAVTPEAVIDFDAVGVVVRTARPVGQLQAALARFNQAQESLSKAGDPRLARIGELLKGVDPGAGSPAPDRAAAAAARMESLAQLAMELDQTARDRWPKMETEYFLASAPLEIPPEGVSATYYARWIQEARRDAYLQLSPDDDPRRSWDVERRVDEISSQLASIRQSGGGSIEPSVLAGLQGRLDAVGQSLTEVKSLDWNRTEESRIVGRADELDRTLAQIEGEFEGVTGRLAEQWQRVTARLKERASVPGVSSPVLRAAWVQRRDELLARFTEPADLTPLSDRTADLEDFLQRLEQAIPAPTMPGVRPRAISVDALEGALQERREQAVRGLLAQATWSSDRYDPAVIDTRAAAAAQSLAEWSGKVDKACADMARAEELIAGAYAADEAAADGATIAALAASAGEDRVGATVAAVFAPVLDQAAAMQRIRGADAAQLAALAADGREPLVVAMSAWRALPGAGWPGDSAQLMREGDIARALIARASAVGDEARREALTREIRAAQASRWNECAARVQRGTDQAALRQVLGARESFGVPLESLSPTLRFSALADEFSRKAAALQSGASEESIKTTVREFLAKVDGLGLSPAALAPVAAWLEEVRGLVADGQAAPVIDPTTLGPGSTGWRGSEVDERRVRFTSPDGSVWLEFVLVEAGDAPGLNEAAYVCTTELSVGALAAIAGTDARLAQLRSLISEFPPESGAGPKTWLIWNRSGRESVTPADAWYSGADVQAGIQAFGGAVSPPKPGPKTPVTHIGAATAAQVATWVGCRLPLLAEWRGALARYESGGGDWNLRDGAWAAQQSHVRQVIAGGRLGIKYPDEGVFHPDDSRAPTGDTATAGSTSDGTLFFDDVDRPRGRLVLHLVGNVAEYVVMGGEATGVARYGVVGRSALSAPEDERALMDGAALLAGDEAFGWSDVGVRLAFPASGGGGVAPLYRRVQRVGQGAPVLVGVASASGG